MHRLRNSLLLPAGLKYENEPGHIDANAVNEYLDSEYQKNIETSSAKNLLQYVNNKKTASVANSHGYAKIH